MSSKQSDLPKEYWEDTERLLWLEKNPNSYPCKDGDMWEIPVMVHPTGQIRAGGVGVVRHRSFRGVIDLARAQ